MKLQTNKVPHFKGFGNGFQFTFPNQWTIIIKHGPGTKTTQANTEKELDVATMILTSKMGGVTSSDIEVEIINPNKTNMSHKFGGDENSVGYVTPLQLVDLMYVVSKLK